MGTAVALVIGGFGFMMLWEWAAWAKVFGGTLEIIGILIAGAAYDKKPE